MLLLAFAENSIQLVPDGTILIHIALILLMIYVLNKTLFSPINRILEDRERRTHGRSGEAKDILRRVEENLARYERTVREARAEGYRLLEQQRTEAMTERQNRLVIVREEVSRAIEEQKAIIASQAEEAKVNLTGEARRIAATISAQILGRPVGDFPQTGARI